MFIYLELGFLRDQWVDETKHVKYLKNIKISQTCGFTLEMGGHNNYLIGYKFECCFQFTDHSKKIHCKALLSFNMV